MTQARTHSQITASQVAVHRVGTGLCTAIRWYPSCEEQLCPHYHGLSMVNLALSPRRHFLPACSLPRQPETLREALGRQCWQPPAPLSLLPPCDMGFRSSGCSLACGCRQAHTSMLVQPGVAHRAHVPETPQGEALRPQLHVGPPGCF